MTNKPTTGMSEEQKDLLKSRDYIEPVMFDFNMLHLKYLELLVAAKAAEAEMKMQGVREEIGNPFEGLEKQIKLLASIAEANLITDDIRQMSTHIIENYNQALDHRRQRQLDLKINELYSLLRSKDLEAAELVKAEKNRAVEYLKKICWSEEDIEYFLKWGQ